MSLRFGFPRVWPKAIVSYSEEMKIDFMPDFVEVAKLSDVPDGNTKLVYADGEEICLVNLNGKIYAIQERCTHQEGPLHEGYLEGNRIVCPLHAAKFDVITGKVSEETQWATDLKTYEVKVENGKIFVKI